MKRKYEKPALIAEAFEMTESVAACKDASVNEALIVHEGDHFCGTSCSHMVGDNKSAFTQNWNNISLVDYAGGENDMYLFDASNVTCDFVWSKATDTTTDKMYVWGDSNGNLVIDEDSRKVDKTNPFANLVSWLGNRTWSFSEFFMGNGSSSSPEHQPSYKGSSFWS